MQAETAAAAALLPVRVLTQMPATRESALSPTREAARPSR
jgi:hypothetical protein